MPEKTESQTKKNLVEVENVSKSFGSAHILHDISLIIEEGETLTVLGKSGVGKSVLLKVIVGLLPPDSGKVRYEGKSITEASERELNEIRKNIGFLFQGSA